MKVKVFDESHEKDLESAINLFLNSSNIEFMDLKYSTACTVFGDEQIYCFSALIIYREIAKKE